MSSPIQDALIGAPSPAPSPTRVGGSARPTVEVDAEMHDVLLRMADTARDVVSITGRDGAGVDSDEWADAVSTLMGQVDAISAIEHDITTAARRPTPCPS